MPAQQTLPYRPDIQGLRAVAIVLVVLAHAQLSAFAGGFVGVDVFFVLSGYLISGILIREYTNSGTIHLTLFYTRRLKRLLPALFVMLVFAILLSRRLLSQNEIAEQLSSAGYAATWTSNLFYAFSTVDYFSELQARDLFLHTWSLGLEEQFYLLWPLLLAFALSFAGWRSRDTSEDTPLLWLFGVLFTVSLALMWRLTKTHPLWAFYLMPSRIWQFALGALIFLLHHRKNNGTTNAPTTQPSAITGIRIQSVGLVMIIGSAILLHRGMTYPGWWALFPSIGAALVIAAAHYPAGLGGSQLLTHPALVWIGNRSYSWYLWHWPVFMLGVAWGVPSRVGGTTCLILLSLLFAMLSYRWIELPFWKGRTSHMGPARVILVSLLAMLTVIALPLNYLRPPAPDMPIIYDQGCDSGYASAEVNPCVIGNAGAPKTVVLLGDSIAAQWVSLLPGIFPAAEWRTVVLTKSSCAMVDEDYFAIRIGQIYTACAAWRNKALDYLSSLRPDIIFVGSAATYGFSESEWQLGSARILARLTAAAGQVFVMAGTPHLSFNGPACLDKRASVLRVSSLFEAPSCREVLTTTQAADVARYLARAVEKFPTARLLDLNDLVCPGGICAAQGPDGGVVFRDSQHLTDSFVRALIPIIARRIAQKSAPQ